MTSGTFTVYVVDDDAGVRNAIARRLRTVGYDVEPCGSPAEFLARHDPARPACAVLDVAMPGLDGLALQQALAERGSPHPVIFLTGRGSIPMSVRAMRAGALDFLTKPVQDADLLAAIARAEVLDAENRKARGEASAIAARLATLTPREREVLSHLVADRRNKAIARDLGTVEQTIKVHRRRVMEKLGVRTLVELARLMEKAGKPRD